MSSQPMLTLNTLLSLLIRAKRTGKGMLGNGRLLIRLLETAADDPPGTGSRERKLLEQFGGTFALMSDGYRRVDKLLFRFLPAGGSYPYEQIRFTHLEQSFRDPAQFRVYLARMRSACDEIFDPDRLEPLVYTLLCWLEQDQQLHWICYGTKVLEKSMLRGSYAHPVRICPEALLLGLLYQLHRDPAAAPAGECSLLDPPERSRFLPERYETGADLGLLLDPHMQPNPELLLAEHAKRPYALPKLAVTQGCWQLEVQGTPSSSAPVFLYGSAGSGKTWLLREWLRTHTGGEQVCLYLSLDALKDPSLPDQQLLAALLCKYCFQDAYASYRVCAACEDAQTLQRMLTDLDALFRNRSITAPRYLLLLDGWNQLPRCQQDALARKLAGTMQAWKNVRLVMTGRRMPEQDVFSAFQPMQVLGISQTQAASPAPDGPVPQLLRLPGCMQVYLEQGCTNPAELLDACMKRWMVSQQDGAHAQTLRFLIRFALPFAAKAALDRQSSGLYRWEIQQAAEQAYAVYLEQDAACENLLIPNGFSREILEKERGTVDFASLLLDDLCWMQPGDRPRYLQFPIPIFRDYLAARHILNLLELLDTAYGCIPDQQELWFNRFRLGELWFSEDDQQAYQLLGQLAGDARNHPALDPDYDPTILDRVLDMCRQFDAFRATENVIRTMAAVRGNVLCLVNFNGTSLPLWIPAEIRFSLHGEDACTFRRCSVYLLEALELDPPEGEQFLQCDFRKARFLKEEYKTLLAQKGAIVDEGKP